MSVDSLIEEELRKVLAEEDLELALTLLNAYKREGARGVKELIRRALREVGVDVVID